jgi:excisionase family DNA binding protein
MSSAFHSPQRLAYSIADVVAMTGVCRSSVYTAIADGKLKATKNGRRTLIRARDVERWLDQMEKTSPRARTAA